MPLVLILVLLDISLVVHAAKTGRAQPWAYIILMVPGVGAVAYVVAVLIPGSYPTALLPTTGVRRLTTDHCRPDVM